MPDPNAKPTPDSRPPGMVPGLMMNLMRRRKTQFRLRRRQFVGPLCGLGAAVEVGSPGDTVAESADSAVEFARLTARLRGEESRRREAEGLAALRDADLLAAQAEMARANQRHEEMVKQLEDAKQQVQRAHSDMDMQRRRLQKERTDAQSHASEEVLRSLFPVLDNFAYAVDLAESGQQNAESMAKGIVMIQRELASILSRAGLDPIREVAVPFDPVQHDAVSADNDPAQPNGFVLQVLRPGYRLKDKILRPAMVKVNRTAAPTMAGASDRGLVTPVPLRGVATPLPIEGMPVEGQPPRAGDDR